MLALYHGMGVSYPKTGELVHQWEMGNGQEAIQPHRFAMFILLTRLVEDMILLRIPFMLLRAENAITLVYFGFTNMATYSTMGVQVVALPS